MEGIRTPEDFGRALRALKTRAERTSNRTLTCRRLAEVTGYGKSTISSWLRGRSLPPADKLDDLLHALAATAPESAALATRRDEISDTLREAQPPGPEPAPGIRLPSTRRIRWRKVPAVTGTGVIAAVTAGGLAAGAFLAGKAAAPGGSPSSPARAQSATTGPGHPGSPPPTASAAGMSGAAGTRSKWLLARHGIAFSAAGDSAGAPPGYDMIYLSVPTAVLEFRNGHISIPAEESISYQACTHGTAPYPGTSIRLPGPGLVLCYTTADSVTAIRIMTNPGPDSYPRVGIRYQTWPAR